MRLPSTLFSHVLKTFYDGDSSTPLEGCFPVTDYSHCKIFLYVKMKPFPVQPVSIAPSLFHVAPYEGLFTLCRCPLSTGKLWRGPPDPSLLQGAATRILQSFLTGQVVLQPFGSSSWPSFRPSPVCPWLSRIVGTGTGHSTPTAVWQVLSRVRWSCLYLR